MSVHASVCFRVRFISHAVEVQCTRTVTLCFIFLELLCYFSYLWRGYIPIIHSCPLHISQSLKAIYLKRHRWIYLIAEKCSAQDSLLCALIFWSYCPLLFFILHFCADHYFYTIKDINLKLHRWVYLIYQKYRAKEPSLFVRLSVNKGTGQSVKIRTIFACWYLGVSVLPGLCANC